MKNLRHTRNSGDVTLTARTLWLLSAKVLGFAFTVVLPLILVRKLSQHEFGLYKQAFLVVGSAVALLPVGFQMSAFFFLPREPTKQNQIVLNILLFHIFTAGLGGLALLFYPRILVVIFRSWELVPYAPLIAAVIFLWVVSSLLEVISVAHQEARLSTIFIVSSQFTKTSLLICAAMLFSSVRGLIIAAIIQGLVQTIVLLLYLNSRFTDFWGSFDRSFFKMQLSYALPLGFAGLLYILQTDLHNYFVSHQFDAATYAIYAVGCFDIPLVGLLSDSVGAVMIPQVSALQKRGEIREIIELTARAMRKLAVVFLPMYGFLLVMGREIIGTLFTATYEASWPIFAVNITLLPLNILMLDPIMRAYAEHRHFLLKLYGVLVGVLLLTFWFGAGNLGLVGTILVVVGVNAAGRFAIVIKVVRVLNLTWHDVRLLKDIGKTAIVVFISVLVTMLVRSVLANMGSLLLLGVCGAVFGAIVLVASVRFDIISPAERMYFKQLVGSFGRLGFASQRGEVTVDGEKRKAFND